MDANKLTILDWVLGILGVILVVGSIVALFVFSEPEERQKVYIPGHWEEVHELPPKD